MNTLLNIFIANILPIFLIAGAGYALGKLTTIDPRSFARVVFYIFTPSLVFTSLANSQLENSAILQTALYAFVVTSIIGLITWLVCRVLKMSRELTAAILLSVMFTNAGNYGISLVLFAFGEVAVPYALIYFTANAVMLYSIGVVIASMGKKPLKSALLNLLKIPTIYALILALIFTETSWELPIFLDRAINLLSGGAIPAMLILLGLQLERVNWREHTGAIVTANFLRLAVAPIIAIAVSMLFGLQGPARQANIIEVSTPSAVTNIVVATEFDAAPSVVTTIVTTTTLLSPLSLTPLIAFLGS